MATHSLWKKIHHHVLCRRKKIPKSQVAHWLLSLSVSPRYSAVYRPTTSLRTAGPLTKVRPVCFRATCWRSLLALAPSVERKCIFLIKPSHLNPWLIFNCTVLKLIVINTKAQMLNGNKQWSLKDTRQRHKIIHRATSWDGLSWCTPPSLPRLLLQARGSSWQPYCSRGFWEERIVRQLHHQGPSEPSGPLRPQEECDAFYCKTLCHTAWYHGLLSLNKENAVVVCHGNNKVVLITRNFPLKAVEYIKWCFF